MHVNMEQYVDEILVPAAGREARRGARSSSGLGGSIIVCILKYVLPSHACKYGTVCR